MFDPYHKWLGIKPGQQPPTYYQLLGVEPDEQDAEVIEEAAVRQTTHVRAYQIGEHAGDCTRLLNEISQARTVLLNPAKRSAYDARLAQQSGKIRKPPPPVPVPAAASAFDDLTNANHATVDITRQHHGKRAPKQGAKTMVLLAAAAGALVPIAVALFFILSPRETTPPPAQLSDPPLAELKKSQTVQTKPETRPITMPDTTPIPQRVVVPPPPVVTPLPPRPVVVPPPPPAVDPNPPPPAALGGDVEQVAEIRQMHLGVANSVCDFAFAPDSRHVFVASNPPSLWDVTTGQQLRRFGARRGGTSEGAAAVVGDGSRAVAAVVSDQVIHLWHAQTGAEQGQFRGHGGAIICLAVSRDGRRLLSGSRDMTVRLWDVDTQQSLGMFNGPHNFPCGVTFLPGGRRALTTDRTSLKLWDVDTRQVIRTAPAGQVMDRSLSISADGRFAVTGHSDGSLKLWDVETFQCVRRIHSPEERVRVVALSLDGRFIAAGGGMVRVDSKTIRTGTAIRVWEAATGRLLRVFEGHTKRIAAVALSPDGRLVLSATSTALHLWPVTGGKAVVVKPLTPPPAEVKVPVVVKPPPPEVKVPVVVKPPPAVKEPVVVKPAEQPRAAVPEATQLTQAEKAVQELFQKEYARKAPADKVALADKLLGKAQQTRDDPPGRFVLLREARDLAAQAGDAGKAFQAIEELDKAYIIDALEMKATALTLAGNAPLTATTGRDVAELALSTVDYALAADNFDAAGRLVAAAERVARRTQPKVFLVQVQRRERLVHEVQKEYEKVKGLAATLVKDPDNAEANLVTGQYLCCRKGDWDKGLPLLARGRDHVLKALAQKDLARPKEAPTQTELGDGWWDRGQKETAVLKAALLVRASYWYRQALPGLTGLLQARVEQRVKQVEEQQGPAHLADNLGEIRRFKGHFGAVTCVAISSDGKWALSGGVDGTVRAWEVASGTLVRRCAGQAGAITGVAFYAANKFTALSTSKDGTTFIWDLRTARVLYKLATQRNGSYNLGGAFSADGQFIATVSNISNFSRSAFARGSGNGFASPRKEEVRGMAATRDLRLLVVNDGSGEVRLYDASTYFSLLGNLAGNPHALGVAVSADGTQILTAGEDHVVRLWNGLSKQEVRACTGHNGHVRCVAFSPDGQRALSGGEDKTVRLWDLNTGQELRRFALHTGTVLAVAYSPDSRQALSASTDGTLRLWSLPPR